MNLKIALAAALLLTGGTYVSQAQQKTKTTQTATATTAKDFNKKVKAFEKATDAAESATLLAELKQQMIDGVTTLKTQAMNSTNKAESDKMVEHLKARDKAISEVMNLGSNLAANKATLVQSLKNYAATL